MILSVSKWAWLFIIALFFVFLLPISGWSENIDNEMVTSKNRDYIGELKKWEPRANAGDFEAQYNLGLMFELGLGVEQDLKEAAHWYSLSYPGF